MFITNFRYRLQLLKMGVNKNKIQLPQKSKSINKKPFLKNSINNNLLFKKNKLDLFNKKLLLEYLSNFKINNLLFSSLFFKQLINFKLLKLKKSNKVFQYKKKIVKTIYSNLTNIFKNYNFNIFFKFGFSDNSITTIYYYFQKLQYFLN